MTTLMPHTWEELSKRAEEAYNAAAEHHIAKKVWAVLFNMLLGVLAITLTVVICSYIIYTISFIVPPYFRFMYEHGPYSFLLLIGFWAIALTRFLCLSPDDPLAFKWEVCMYGLSTFLMFTGIGAFAVVPFLDQKE
jgi:hypothetical protein